MTSYAILSQSMTGTAFTNSDEHRLLPHAMPPVKPTSFICQNQYHVYVVTCAIHFHSKSSLLTLQEVTQVVR